MSKWKHGDLVKPVGYAGRGRVMPAVREVDEREDMVRVRMSIGGKVEERIYHQDALEEVPGVDPFNIGTC